MQMEDSERHKNAWLRCVRLSDYFVFPSPAEASAVPAAMMLFWTFTGGECLLGKLGDVCSGGGSRREGESQWPDATLTASASCCVMIAYFMSTSSSLQKSFQCIWTHTPSAELSSHEFHLIFSSQCVLQCVKEPDGNVAKVRKMGFYPQGTLNDPFFPPFFIRQCALDLLLCFQQSRIKNNSRAKNTITQNAQGFMRAGGD